MARPREFIEEDVVEKAMHVFWKHGYDGASMADLLDAMGLTKSSLYKAFGSKAALFERTAERYYREHLGFRREALAQPTPRGIVEKLLFGMADLHTGVDTPPGCLETNASLACGPADQALVRDLARKREAFKNQLRDRFDATRSAGPLPVGMTSEEAASLVCAIIQGMAVQARGGVKRKALHTVVRAALLAWPKTKRRADKRPAAAAARVSSAAGARERLNASG